MRCFESLTSAYRSYIKKDSAIVVKINANTVSNMYESDEEDIPIARRTRSQNHRTRAVCKYNLRI